MKRWALCASVLPMWLLGLVASCDNQPNSTPAAKHDAGSTQDSALTNECSVDQDTELIEVACGDCGKRTQRCVPNPKGRDALGRDGMWHEASPCTGDTSLTVFNPFDTCSLSGAEPEPCGTRGQRCGAEGNWLDECIVDTELVQEDPCGDTSCNANRKRTCRASGAWSSWSVCSAPAGSVECDCPGHFATGTATCDSAGKVNSRCRGCAATSCNSALGGAPVEFCESPEVPGGTFVAGGSTVVAGATYAMPTQIAQLSSFRLDRYEVTVARFRSFVMAGGPLPEPGDVLFAGDKAIAFDASWYGALNTNYENGSNRTYDPRPGANDSKPINHIGYYTALVFCWWDGGRLPTAHEWEYAARGGAEQRDWPWGSGAPDAARMLANCGGDASCTVSDILPVGSRPAGAGLWGQLDLAGSVAEWTLDGINPFAGSPPSAIAAVCPSAALDAVCHKPDQYETLLWGGHWQTGVSTFYLAPMFWPASSSVFTEVAGIRCARD